MKIFLEDRETNTFTRLDEVNSNYKTTLNENLNGIGRFYLYTIKGTLQVDENQLLESISMYKVDNYKLRITGLSQGKSEVAIYNLLGKVLLNTAFISDGLKDIVLPNLSIGVYLLKLKTQNGQITKKIILE